MRPAECYSLAVIRFRSEFLRRFPPHLRNELQQLPPLVNGLESRAASAPQLTWPPPETPQEKLDFFLEMLWQSNVRRAVALYRGIVESLNESNFLVFAVLFRALFEQSCSEHIGTTVLARSWRNPRKKA